MVLKAASAQELLSPPNYASTNITIDATPIRQPVLQNNSETSAPTGNENDLDVPSESMNNFMGNLSAFVKSIPSMIQPPTQCVGPQGGTRTPQAITPQNTRNLAHQLKQEVSSSRGTNETDIKAVIDSKSPPPNVSNVCTTIMDSDLKLVTRVKSLPFYIDQRAMNEGQRMLQENGDALVRFSKVVLFLGGIFECPVKALHIYWDQDSSTIAFNRNKQLFFNFRYYLGLHYTGSIPGQFFNDGLSSESRQCFYYWFMTFCHELAHHFVGEHNAQHEHYMSAFAENYMGSLLTGLLREKIL